MNLPALAVKRPVATGTILILILAIGLVSLYQSPLDLLPDIQAPVLAVITTFPGSSPQETLELVTKPIEESVSAVGGLTGINSISQENLSLVILRFDWGVDVKRLREDLNVRMDLLSFPDGVQRPILLEFDPTLMPIMQVSASGIDDPVLLTEWLEETAAPRLESVRGVAGVQVQGGARQDLFIRTSPDIMAEYEISFEQIANVLRASLIDFPAGIIDLEDRRVRIRFLGRYNESELLSDLIVGFQVDLEALEALIGAEIDINLNQLLAGQGNILSGGGSPAGPVPVRDVYWDDLFDFDRALLTGSDLFIPLQEEWLARNEAEIESRLFLFTANPNVSYDAPGGRMALSLESLGRLPLAGGDRLPAAQGGDVPRLEEIWIIDQAVWDRDRVIVPLDPLSLDRLAVTPDQLESLAAANPLINGSGSNYLLLSFHEDWENIRNSPIISIPDYGAWLGGLQQQAERGLAETTRLIEGTLNELAVSLVLASMAPGGSSFAGIELGDDFPIIPVSLDMIAEVEQDTYEPAMIARYNRQPTIGLSIQKEGDANTVLVARQVREVLAALSAESEGSFSKISFNTVFDQAEEIERALADLAWALFGGAILAILVLLLFLRNWRTTMFIGLSIPAAIIATFTLLYFANLTINLMTLGGLALAAGMLVDNAIVVSENIFRHYQMGHNPDAAAVEGAREVSGAITASTLTTISVFFPVVFLSGLAGQLFWEFALTVGCAILASLLVALTVIPLLASKSLGRNNLHASNGPVARRLPTYRRLLGIAVRHPWWVLVFALLFVASGAFGFTTLGSELFPSPDESSFSIDITLPPGSTMNLTDQYVAAVEEILADREEVLSLSSRIGGSRFMVLPAEGGSSNQARIRVRIDPLYLGEIDRIIAEVRAEAETLPIEAEAAFSRESVLDSAGLETRLDLVVSGDNLEEVINITGQAAAILSAHPRFSDVQSSIEENRPEIHIKLDHGLALQKGVTLVQVATAVRQALEGIPVSRIETDSGILNLVLGYRKSDIRTIADLGEVGFYSPAGEYLQLREVAALEEAFGPQSIARENRQVVGQIQLQYGDIDLGTATTEALESLAVIDLPSGFEIKAAGSSLLMGDVLSELQLVLLLAALLVYLVMAAQFESLLHPFIIICSLPLAYTGAVIALIVTGSSISVPAMVGVVVLSGILVNDGIIMVDFINQQRRQHGLKLHEAVIEGAVARLRPILMTTATTVLGLFPLALGFGEGGQIQAPMGITIIGGQITGTILLLLAIPSIYVVLTRDKGAPAGSLSAAVNGAGAHPPRERAARAFDDRIQGSIPLNQGTEQYHDRPGGRPLIGLVFRLVVVLLVAVVIAVLFFQAGQTLPAVIR